MRYNIYSAHSGAFLCSCTERNVYMFQTRHCIAVRQIGELMARDLMVQS